MSGAPIGLTWRLSYIPSGSALQFLSKIRIGNPATLLVLGNPTGDLPFAETEASYIAALYDATPLSAEQATEKVLKGKIGKAKLLHFATHGYLSEISPLESAIALAKGEKLTRYELMGMEIQADLVVLSACNTARGETTGGDDVLGLTRGLLAAGAKNAMVSLWAVDDLSTSLLMGRFYTLLKKGTPPAEALLEAQKFLAGLDEKSIESALEIIKAHIPDETVRENINRRRAARGRDPVGTVSGWEVAGGEHGLAVGRPRQPVDPGNGRGQRGDRSIGHPERHHLHGVSLIAVIYIGLVALAQTDMKKLVAYSSISHMGSWSRQLSSVSSA